MTRQGGSPEDGRRRGGPRGSSSRALRWALSLHPAGYRAEHEAELTAIYAEATQEAGPAGRLREALDLAGHGLRRRTGLGSDRIAGQVLAKAAPLVAAVATGGALANLLWLVAPGLSLLRPSGTAYQLLLCNQVLVPMVWLAVLAAGWAGRWGLVRMLVVSVTVLRIAGALVLRYAVALPGGPGVHTHVALHLIASLLTAAVVLAAPRDLLGPLSRRRTAIAGAGGLAVLLVGAQLAEAYQPDRLGGPGAGAVLWAAALAVALGLSGRGRLPAAGLALALLPGALQFTVPLLDPLLPVGGVALLLVGLGGAVSLVLGSRRRRVKIDSLS